jgi:hypothetical protein
VTGEAKRSRQHDAADDEEGDHRAKSVGHGLDQPHAEFVEGAARFRWKPTARRHVRSDCAPTN